VSLTLNLSPLPINDVNAILIRIASSNPIVGIFGDNAVTP